MYTHALQTVDMFRARPLHHVYITAILTSSTAGLFHPELLQQCTLLSCRTETCWKLDSAWISIWSFCRDVCPRFQPGIGTHILPWLCMLRTGLCLYAWVITASTAVAWSTVALPAAQVSSNDDFYWTLANLGTQQYTGKGLRWVLQCATCMTTTVTMVDSTHRDSRPPEDMEPFHLWALQLMLFPRHPLLSRK